MIESKIPPQARDLEKAILGAILIESNAMTEVQDILKPECFYVDAHSLIFSTFQKLIANSNPIDLLTVTEQLRKDGKLEQVGGAYFLSELTNTIASSDNIEYHARIVLQKYMQRELIRISNEITKESYEDTTDVFDLIDNCSIQIDNIKSSIYGSSVNSAFFSLTKLKKDLINPPDKPKSVPSILDIRHDLSTVDCFGAKPNTGKTAVMIQGSIVSAQEGNTVGILSLELNKRLLTAKYTHYLSGIFAKDVIRYELSDNQKETFFNCDFSILNRIIIDDSHTTSNNIRSKIITLNKKFGCTDIWLDYIQLITLISGKNQTDVKGMELVMTTLQQTAKELDISIKVLSQITRGVDKPSMEELRGGGIEQACSMIFLLHDENAKEVQGVPFLEVREEIRGQLLLIDDKQRFDDKSNRYIYYDKIAQRIYDWNTKPMFRQSGLKEMVMEEQVIF